jgi:hypothetical protein
MLCIVRKPRTLLRQFSLPVHPDMSPYRLCVPVREIFKTLLHAVVANGIVFYIIHTEVVNDPNSAANTALSAVGVRNNWNAGRFSSNVGHGSMFLIGRHLFGGHPSAEVFLIARMYQS